VEKKITIEKLKPDDLEAIRLIRNTPFVREICWNDKEITLDSQFKWFEKIIKDKDTNEFAIFYGDETIGACSLHVNSAGRHAEFGVFLDEKYTRLGLGKVAMSELLEYGWNILKLHKIWGQVFDFNKQAIKFYQREDFVFEATFKDHIFRNEKFYDVHIITKFNPYEG